MSLPSYIQSLALNSYDVSDHHSLTKDIISMNVAFVTLVTLATGIRMSIRLFMIHAAGLDDWLMFLAAIFTILLSTFGLLGAHFGLGTHIWLLAPAQDASLEVFLERTKRITQCLYGCYLAYATAITLVKASIIVSYLRIFPNRPFRLFVYCTLVLLVLMWVCSVFVIVFECVPVSAAWDWTTKGRCIDVLKYFYISSVVNIATDLVLVVAPLPLLWGMNMKRGERVMLCGLFGFGFFAFIASILRLAQLHGLHSKDITYTSVPSLNWSVAEVSTAILCACIPCMRPLAVVILPRSFLSSLTPSTRSNIKREQNTNAGTELSESPMKGRNKCGGDEEDGDWEELREGRDRDRLDERVDLKDILREGGMQGREVEESPPQTPSANKLVGVDEKL